MTPTELFWACAAFAFMFGAIIGSFLNVVIYRVPAKLSIVSPGSRCPTCHTPVRWFDNIPIVSWFVLGGKCRDCGAPFSVRYAAVEALTGILAVAAWWQVARGLLRMEHLDAIGDLTPVGIMFLVRFCLFAFLVVITFIDLDTFLIPHVIALPGIAIGLLSPWIAQWVMGPVALHVLWPPVTPVISLAGAIAGFLLIVGLFYLYFAIRGAEGIGGGDATLMALIGAWLGWPALIFVLFAASVQGVLVAGITILFGVDFAKDAATIFDDDDAPADPAPGEGGPEEEDPAEEAELPEAPIEPAEPVEEEADAVAEGPHDEGGSGQLAVPFGPFLALAALEFALFGPYLPEGLNMIYFYF